MSDVTAVVLTLGEPTLERALRSLERQSLQPAEIVIVRGVRPFSKALNLGATRVRTPFFIQVDSDMVLDPECIELLRAGIGREVGIAVGQLRDPLIGPIAGVKLFRRACFEQARVPNSIVPDVDFYYELGARGWLTLHVARYDTGSAALHTHGEHRPPYTPAYTFATYYQLGARYRHRGEPSALRWRLDSLRRSNHEMAPVARLAFGHGLFATPRHDTEKRQPNPREAEVINALVEGRSELATRLRAFAATDAGSSWHEEAVLCHSACEPEAGEAGRAELADVLSGSA